MLSSNELRQSSRSSANRWKKTKSYLQVHILIQMSHIPFSEDAAPNISVTDVSLVSVMHLDENRMANVCCCCVAARVERAELRMEEAEKLADKLEWAGVNLRQVQLTERL